MTGERSNVAEREAGGRPGPRRTGNRNPGACAPAAPSPRGAGRTIPQAETPELRRLRRRIDALDRRIVELLSERARLGMQVGAAKAAGGRRAVRDVEREREVLLRVAMANHGPLRQADLLALYRRVIAATRGLEAAARRGARATAGAPRPTDAPGPGGPAPHGRDGRPAPPDPPKA
jgi:chorismate mutase/prephenate dehydratase